MDIRLYDWGPSPFCLKVRAILDYKGVEYRRVSVLGPKIFEVKRRGKIGKVPALDIDGRLVTDSTDIAHELERLFPTPSIVPDAPRERALCHALEDWADEALYFIGLYYQWLDKEGRPMVPKAFGDTLFGRMAYRLVFRRVRGQLIGHGTARKRPAHVESDLLRELEAIEALLTPGPFLLGERAMLCDFALMGQLVYWTRPPKTARALEGRTAIAAYLERMRALRGKTSAETARSTG